MKIDYLTMCSKCEVRMHPDDYKKHKKHCKPNVEYVPYPVYPQQPYQPWPAYPYPTWVTGTTSTDNIIYVDGSTTTTVDGNVWSAGVTQTYALSS